MNFDEIKKHFDKLKENPPYTVNKGKKGAIIGLLDKACGSKDNRYQFAAALGMKPHTGDWSAGEWYAVSQMVKPDKSLSLGWIATEPKFQEIIGAIMAKVGRSQSQIEMFTVAPDEEAQKLVEAVRKEVEVTNGV